MKNLIVSIICLLVLIVPWLIYDKYSTNAIEYYTKTIKEETIPAVKREEWHTAETSFAQITDDWQRFEKVSEYFLDTESVKEASHIISETKYHILMKDADNAAARSAKLINVLSYLHENELLTTGNVF